MATEEKAAEQLDKAEQANAAGTQEWSFTADPEVETAKNTRPASTKKRKVRRALGCDHLPRSSEGQRSALV